MTRQEKFRQAWRLRRFKRRFCGPLQHGYLYGMTAQDRALLRDYVGYRMQNPPAASPPDAGTAQ